MKRCNKSNDSFEDSNNVNDIHKKVGDDPLKHNVKLTKWQWIRTYIFTITVFPVRVVTFLILCLLANLMAKIGLRGISETEVQETQLNSRISKFSQKTLIILSNIACSVCGFKFTVRGNIAPVNEASILVVAPHSTFFDAFPKVCIDYVIFASKGGQPASCLIAEEYKKLPIIGIFFQIYQYIFVKRNDPCSRENTSREVMKRTSLNSHADKDKRWPHIIFFPEGMCSNRKALLPFKPGAFYPGKPVQPITFRYINKVDTVTWTWDQSHGAMSIFWLTLTQPRTNVEIDFLPVYYPNTKEKEDPKFFASNVRKLMAKHLDVPMYDVTLNEVKERYVKKK